MDRWRGKAVVPGVAMAVGGPRIVLLAVIVRMPMPMGMAVALPLGRIGAALRQEGSLPMLQMQTPLPQQIGEHRIIEQP